jgi:hypothetical protein
MVQKAYKQKLLGSSLGGGGGNVEGTSHGMVS